MALRLKRIVVATDFSDCSTAALRYASRLAAALPATLNVLHVIETPASLALDTALSGVDVGGPRTLAELAREDAEQRLRRQLAEVDERVEIDMQLLYGKPRDAILQELAAGGWDLLVLGTHGRSGPARMMMGSIAEGVLRRAACPVLIVPAERAAP